MLVMIVLVPLFLGIVQVGLVLLVRNTLASAASEGARVAATADGGPGDGVARTRQQIAGAISGRYARQVTAQPTLVGGAPGVAVTVRAEVPALGLFGPAVPLEVTGPGCGGGAVRWVGVVLGLVARPRAASHLDHRPGRAASHLDHRRDERGTAIVEFVWLGILLLVPLLWIVLSVFEVQRGAFGVSGAARAAGRAYALAPSDAEGERRARAAARQALVDQGLPADVPVTVRVSCSSPGTSCHSGGAVITVRVDSRVDLPLLPDVLGGGRPGFALDASHTVPIGQYQEVR